MFRDNHILETGLSVAWHLPRLKTEIVTLFSARLYGSRSHKTRKLLDVVKDNALELSRL